MNATYQCMTESLDPDHIGVERSDHEVSDPRRAAENAVEDWGVGEFAVVVRQKTTSDVTVWHVEADDDGNVAVNPWTMQEYENEISS